jgi:hypothetical protein
MLGDLISVEGAIDLHIHTHPCLFPRITDDQGMVQASVNAGVAAVMLKSHFESTVSRAYHLNQQFPMIKVFGGIVLNSYVGGFNPTAVEACLKMGGKQVWMPTIDAAHHAEVFGSTGRYDVQTVEGDKPTGSGITVFKDGKLLPEIYDILDLVAGYNAILGTSHLSVPEIRAVVVAAKERKVQKVLITHPLFKAPRGLDARVAQELVALGAVAEFGHCTISPMWAYSTIEATKNAIDIIGPDHCTLMSDAGQRHNPMPCEALRIFAQCLYEKGLPRSALERMMIDNPKQLLDMD